MGLRERHRERRRKEILLAAETLFKRQTYEGTGQEEIASRAEVSPGTLYNYFPSKADLLLAIVVSADEACVEESRAIIESPPQDPVAALTKVASLASAHSIQHLDKKIWRHVLAAIFTNSQSEFGQRYAITTGRLRQVMVDMLTQLQEKRRLGPDFDPVEVGYYLHSLKHALFSHFILDDGMTFEEHSRQIRRAFATVVAGIRMDESATQNGRSRRRPAK